MVSQVKSQIQRNPSLYYRLIMSVGPHIRMAYFKRFIRQYLMDDSLTILDAGFGRGEHLHWLEARLPSATLHGYDLAETATYTNNFDIARQRVTRSQLHQVDLTQMTDENRFDVIYTTDILTTIGLN